MTEMYMDINDVYYILDLPGIGLGGLLGWYIDDGLIEPDFSSQLTENDIPCLVLDYIMMPRYIK